MAKTKTADQFGIAKNKEIDIPIELLRVTPDVDGVWFKKWIEENGEGVKVCPQYLYLVGDFEPMWDWMRFRHLPSSYIVQPLMKILKSIIYEGQKEPIKIYKDMRINTGHKRVACLAYLGAKTIKAIIVSDDTKL